MKKKNICIILNFYIEKKTKSQVEITRVSIEKNVIMCETKLSAFEI